jgi:hypothetical protein
MVAAIGLAACAQGLARFDDVNSDDDASSSAGGAGGMATVGGGGTGGEVSNLPCGIDCNSIETDACHEARCNTESKKCEIISREPGTSCDDGAFCTMEDTCNSTGECVGGPMNDCGMTPPDCQMLVCNELSRSCGTAPANDGTSCTATDLCKVNAVCQAGLCSGGTEKDCFFAPLPNECHVGECDPQNGLCQPIAGNDGQSCDDASDVCTIGKTCSSGTCIGGQAKDCSQLTQGCVDGVCNPQSGNCEAMPIPAGGLCAEATDQCNQGICDNNANCVGQAANEGQSCNDNSFCSSGDHCASGTCVGTSYITECLAGDLCCPPGCTIQTDSDCQPNMITKDAIERGWWKSSGQHTAFNNNTLTGRSILNNEYNSYFIFDLTGVTGTVIVASLKMEIEGYTTPDASETLSIWDVNTAPATLEASGNDVAIYNDLMTGNSYGTFIVTSADKGMILDIPLNAQAVTDMNNALGGKVSVGLHVDTLGAASSEWIRFSAGSEQRTHQLVIGVL